MPMFRWFRAFLPREERFFDLFARHFAVVAQGARALPDMLKGGDETPVYWQRGDPFDQMQQTAKAVLLFEVREFEPLMREMGTLLVECADLTGRAIPLLQS